MAAFSSFHAELCWPTPGRRWCAWTPGAGTRLSFICVFFLSPWQQQVFTVLSGGHANPLGAMLVDSVAFDGPMSSLPSGGTFWKAPDKAPVWREARAIEMLDLTAWHWLSPLRWEPLSHPSLHIKWAHLSLDRGLCALGGAFVIRVCFLSCLWMLTDRESDFLWL